MMMTIWKHQELMELIIVRDDVTFTDIKKIDNIKIKFLNEGR